MQKDERIEFVIDKLIVGIDIAKHKHWARIIDCHGRDLRKPFRFENNKEGFDRLAAEIQLVQQKAGMTGVVVGMEPTGHYWKPLARWLQGLGYTVVMVNPMWVKRHKEDYDNSPSKSDRKDTGVVAGLVKDGKYMQVMLPTGVYADLRELIVVRRQQKQALNSGLNRLETVLDEYFPEFHTVFKGTLGLAAQCVLTECPFPSYITALNVEELTDKLKRASNNRVGQKRAQLLRDVAARSIGVTEGLQGARERLESTLAEIRFLKDRLRKTETAMAEKLYQTGLAESLLSIPGVGVATAAGFLGEIGDPHNYENWRQIRNLAGLNLKENSSGNRESHTEITKRGRPGLRSLIYQIAVTAVACNPQLRALYRYFLARDVNPLTKKQALIAVGLKLVRIMHALMMRGQRYDPALALGEVREFQLEKQAA
ncbi:MAG: IS110 family transposase [Limnochordia bacterium]|jgi:transposase